MSDESAFPFHGSKEFEIRDDDGNFKMGGESPHTSWGLTKREYFAAKAMAALLSNTETMEAIADSNESIQSLAVKAADVLIAELAKARP